MFDICIGLLILMAGVMARGHGGDGFGGDPPNPHGWRQHQDNPTQPRRKEPKKKGRGRTKGKKLKELWEANNREPLKLPLDTFMDFTPVGDVGKLFCSEASKYMWENIPMHMPEWDDVDGAFKHAMWVYLRDLFNLEEFDNAEEEISKKAWAALDKNVQNTYRYRKRWARRQFHAMDGTVEERRLVPPDGIQQQRWSDLIDFWQTPEFIKKSNTNQANRSKQTSLNRGGSCKLSSTAHKEQGDRVYAFKKHNTDQEGHFHNPADEERYEQLVRGLTSAQNALAGNPLSRSEVVSVFEDVLGSRAGHRRGLGTKPACDNESSSRRGKGKGKGKAVQSDDHPSNIWDSLEDMQRMFSHPNFQMCMQQAYGFPQPTIPPNWVQNTSVYVPRSIDDDGDDGEGEHEDVGHDFELHDDDLT